MSCLYNVVSFPPWGLVVMVCLILISFEIVKTRFNDAQVLLILTLQEALNQVSSQTQSRISDDLGNETIASDFPSADHSVADKKPISSTDLNTVPKTEFSKARDGVHLVFSAFQKQEDEEMTARLSRKNVQGKSIVFLHCRQQLIE